MADDFGDFTAFSSAETNGSAASQSQQPKLPPLQFDADFQIPPPMSGSDIHMAGGVPFDIPPLPFDDFSPEPELENPLGPVFPIATVSEPTVSGDVSITSAVQPVAFGDFASTDSLTTAAVNSESKTNNGWAADFDSFTIPPPLEMNESLEGVSDHTPVTSEAANDSEQFGDFSSFNSAPQPVTTASATVIADDKGIGLKGSTTTQEFVSNESSTGDAPPSPPADNEFGDFSSGQKPSEDVSSNIVLTSKGASNDFTNFASFESPPLNSGLVSEKESSEPVSFGADFGDFSSKVVVPVSDDGFADFASFEDASNEPTKEGNFGVSLPTDSTSLPEPSESFGDFNSSIAPPSSSNDFGDFSGPSNIVKDDFGDFSGPSNTVKDDFGDFSGPSNSDKDDFGDFSGSSNTVKDDFGDFSSSGFSDFQTSTGDNFGTFSSGKSVNSMPVDTQALKDISSVLVSCFELKGVSTDNITTSKIITLLQNADKSVWQALLKCIDLTVPLYKWEKSSLQENYYSAIKVDPLLVSRPSTLSVLTGQARFEDPLGGTTAAEDLIESFGFQGEVEDTSSRPRSTTSPPIMASGRQPKQSGGRTTPTLLDLSLPETPGSPTGHGSFTLAEDLLGLDLNPQSKTQQLTSIEELLRNEQLVVNKSTWVDSEIEKFGDNSQPSTPQTAKKHNVEFQLQQLGLDANKVSSYKGNKELSLAARTVLGRLPELSFMLTDSIVEPQKYTV